MTDMTPERIYLVPDEDGYSWCEDPAPGIGMEAADAIEYVRADTLAPKRVAGDMTPEQALEFLRDHVQTTDRSGSRMLVPPHVRDELAGIIRAALSRPAVPADHDERVSRMVDAFLGWKLPHDFAPDCGIEFAPLDDGQSWPIGTNLFTAVQARQMIEHLLAASSTPVLDGWQPIETAPKGVTDVLDLWACGERYTDCIWMKPTYDTEYRWCHEGDRDCDGPVAVPVPNPTHWRRPPAPPAGEKDRYAPTSPTPAPAVPEVTDDDLRALWYAHGGVIEGLHVEKGVMPERDLLLFLRTLRTVDAPAVPEGWRKAMKRLVLVARTTGGTAGPDADLMAACAVCEDMLAAAPAEESSGDHFRDATKMVEGEERTTPEDALVWNGSALSAVRSESGLMRHLSKCAARVAQWPDWKRKAMESAEGDSE